MNPHHHPAPTTHAEKSSSPGTDDPNAAHHQTLGMTKQDHFHHLQDHAKDDSSSSINNALLFDSQGKLKLSGGDDGDTNENPPFCKAMHNGGGMIMYMDGFRFSLQGNQTCLNLLFPTWTLDSRIKFSGAIVAVFFAAFFLEGFSKLRHKIVRTAKQKNHRRRRSDDEDNNDNNNSHNNNTTTTTTTTTTSSRLVLRWVVTCLHGLQALFGYGLMLITMTFSIELLLSTVVGLAAGYAYFFQGDFFGDGDGDNENYHVTSNPCCEFMEEESREVPGVSLCDDDHHDDGGCGGGVVTEHPSSSDGLMPNSHPSTCPQQQQQRQQQRRRWRCEEDQLATPELTEPLVDSHSAV